MPPPWLLPLPKPPTVGAHMSVPPPTSSSPAETAIAAHVAPDSGLSRSRPCAQTTWDQFPSTPSTKSPTFPQFLAPNRAPTPLTLSSTSPAVAAPNSPLPGSPLLPRAIKSHPVLSSSVSPSSPEVLAPSPVRARAPPLTTVPQPPLGCRLPPPKSPLQRVPEAPPPLLPPAASRRLFDRRRPMPPPPSASQERELPRQPLPVTGIPPELGSPRSPMSFTISSSSGRRFSLRRNSLPYPNLPSLFPRSFRPPSAGSRSRNTAGPPLPCHPEEPPPPSRHLLAVA
uniref:Plus agglutinin-like protein n=1 Tax=Oryza sativa subsp. japonica TaxID=39947 RepID=Q6Z1D9_ORYSJ|nr:plus agglutinin-like protein [Oryza sativa Japonica Group]BAD16184.1 plus agglutinin-like protein [Oryza sativa Japonica Group]